MVALLWDEGNVLGAIDLEQAWNDLATRLSFDLFCAYPASAVAGADQVEALHRVCGLHSSVVSTGSGSQAPIRTPLTDAPLADTPRGALELCESFAADTSAPGEARRLLRSTLWEWGHVGELVDDAVLVLGELASNAVRHARSPFSIFVRLEPGSLRLAVEDDDGAAAAEHEMVPKPAHGLAIVDALAERWGVQDAGRGKIVWAELALPG
jgi:anti-sigma regulatory factor (Ser/Thr protein kinase)